jgi:dihydropyrimidinase
MYNLLMLENSKITVENLSDIFSATPAKIFGYYPQKGTLFPGSDADVMIYDPNHSWRVSADLLHMNTDYTPYDGLMLRGKVDSTICGGKFIVKNKEFVLDEPGFGND